MTGYGDSRYGGAPWGGSEEDFDANPEFKPSPYFVPPGRRFGRVPVRKFTGEPSQGLLAGARGLLFFSPALLEPSSSSEMELASLSVRAIAADEYRRPEERPWRLFRFGGGPSLTPSWPSMTNSALYRAQGKEYTVIATLVQTTPPGPTTVIRINSGVSFP